jgi:hypothetical protein
LSDANAPQAIPETVKRLIDRHIRSLGELEILLLARTTKERSWAPEEAGRALRTSTEAASIRLAELAHKGFLTKAADGYRYAARGELDTAVGDLEHAYARYRTRIVSMIFE